MTGLSIIVISAFVALAISIQLFARQKNFAFSFWVMAAVSAAMFYPHFFTHIGDFNTSGLIVPLLMLIMFGMGTAMSIQDFVRVVKMPKGVLIGILCQFTIMPLVGFTIVKLFEFPPEIAGGIILVGCSPSGLASNVMSYIANANLALSLTLTAIATMLAPVLTPLLMKVLADQYVPIAFVPMMQSILKIVIVPVIAGLLFNHFFKKRFPWMDKAMPIVSMVGIAVVITVITAAGRDSLMKIGVALVIAALIHNTLGYVLGYWLCRLAKMEEASCRTIALEVGMQNSGLASGIALEMGKVATMGLAPAIFGPLMNISGSTLATWWRSSSGQAEE